MVRSRQRRNWIGAATAALSVLAAAPAWAEEAPWLRVDVAGVHRGAVHLRITNLSNRGLHALGARGWGYANYVRVGFETVPFLRVDRRGRWDSARPDLDKILGTVRWTPLDDVLDRAQGRRPTPESLPSLEVEETFDGEIPLPPAGERGNVELVVLARRGEKWLTFRRTVATRLVLAGDLRAGALRGLLLAGMGLLTAASLARASPSGTGAPRIRSRWVWIAHSAAVLSAAAVALTYLHQLHYRELPYTDGVNYAVLARSHMEGHGLRSPVIFPGFMTLVPTGRDGQVFVMQAPLWPLLLAYVFRVAGATALAVTGTGYVLLALTALGVWWIGLLASGRPGVGYLAVGFLLACPGHFAAISNGSTVPLQGALVTALVLLMWAPFRLLTAVVAGTLAGLGMVARENTLFVVLALAACWAPELLRGLRDRARRTSALLALVAALACAAVPLSIEGARRKEALGGVDHPVVRATMLYGTPGFDAHWYWRYDYRPLSTNPVAYFREHPRQLWDKFRLQVGTVFFLQTLPSLLTPAPWFVPVVVPWLLARPRSRRAAWGVVLALALQVVGAGLTFLHPSYFLVFVPALCALVAASLWALAGRAFAPGPVAGRVLAAVLIGYALLPLMLDLSPMTRPGGVTMGDLEFDPRATERVFELVRTRTPADAVIAFGHIPAALLAWETHRTVLSYEPGPFTRPADTEMWRRLDRQLPLDFILLSSFTDAETTDLLGGFELAATERTRFVQAWLFARRTSRPR